MTETSATGPPRPAVPAAQAPAAQAPAAQPGTAARPPAGAHWQRLSARAVIVQPVTDLIRLLPVLAGLLLWHAKTGRGLIFSVLAAAFAITDGLVHWATTRYLITDERVYLRRGLISQRMRSVARDRVRSVDISAHPLHRLLGVCRVSIGTGRNDLRSGESFHLNGLTRSAAEQLRVLLLTAPPDPAVGAAGALPGPGTVADTGGQVFVNYGTEIVRLRLGWLRYAPLTMTGMAIVGALLGTLLQVSQATTVNLASTGPVRLLIADLSGLPLADRIGAAAAAALAGYLLVAAAGYAAVFWKFRLVRVGQDEFRVTRGLLSTRSTALSASRIRGVEISEPLPLRAARGARCLAITTGLRVGEGAERGGTVLLPPAPRPWADTVSRSVLGVPAELCSGPLERHGRQARQRRQVRAVTAAAVLATAAAVATRAAGWPGWAWLSFLALLPIAAALAADRYASLGHRLAGGWLVARTGSLVRRRVILSTDAIIGWRIHQSWFQRRRGLVTLTATTAAGRQRYEVPDVPAARALALTAAATADLIGPFLAGPATAADGEA